MTSRRVWELGVILVGSEIMHCRLLTSSISMSIFPSRSLGLSLSMFRSPTKTTDCFWSDAHMTMSLISYKCKGDLRYASFRRAVDCLWFIYNLVINRRTRVSWQCPFILYPTQNNTLQISLKALFFLWNHYPLQFVLSTSLNKYFSEERSYALLQRKCMFIIFVGFCRNISYVV